MINPWLAGPVTSGAYAWRLERRDGVTIGITSHDHNLEMGGLLYRSSPGLEPATILHSSDLENDGLEIRGAIDNDALNEENLFAGRWDNARLTISLINWTDPDTAPRVLAHGVLGEISTQDGAFEVGVNSLKALLDRPAFPVTSPHCRAQFCDAACGLSRERFRHVASVQSAAGNVITFDPELSALNGNASFGRLRWLQGENCGYVNCVVANAGSVVTLAEAPRFPVLAGQRAEIFEDCDKMLSTCATRYGNAINFRGEPHLPGNDLLMRYPGS